MDGGGWTKLSTMQDLGIRIMFTMLPTYIPRDFFDCITYGLTFKYFEKTTCAEKVGSFKCSKKANNIATV